MSFLEWTKSLFKKKEQLETGVVRVSDAIKTPGREYFKDDNEALIEIDNFKKEYLRLLSNRKTMVSSEIEIENIQYNMKMNLDLILRVIFDDRMDKKYPFSKHNMMIKFAKISLYKQEIVRLRKENLERLIALKELSKDVRFLLSHNKRNVIEYEVDKLTINTIIFTNQIIALGNELTSYVSNSQSKNTAIYSNELLDRKYNVTVIAKVIIPEEDKVVSYNDYVQIAYLERKLEMFLYKNKDYSEKIKNELNKHITYENGQARSQYCLSNIKVGSITEEIKAMRELQLKFEACDLYSKNNLTDDDFMNLYSALFDLYTFELSDEEKSPFLKDDSKEYEYYKEIISRKIDRLLNAKFDPSIILGIQGLELIPEQEEFQTNLNQYDKSLEKKVIRIVSTILKNGKSYFDADEILSDKLLLGLLTSFDYYNGLKKFMENFKINKDYFKNIDYHETIFTWDKQLSLKTIFEIRELNGDKKNVDDFYSLYNLMNKYCSKKDSPIYMLPDGLLSIQAINPFAYKSKILQESDDHFLQAIKLRQNDKTIYFPNSLRVVFGRVFSTQIKDVYLGDNIRTLDRTGIFKNIINVYIPAQLRYLYDEGPFENTKTLTFLNYKNSAILNNKKALMDIIRLLFEYPKTLDPQIVRMDSFQEFKTGLKIIKFQDENYNIKIDCKTLIEKIKKNWLLDMKKGYYNYNSDCLGLITETLLNEVKEKEQSLIKKRGYTIDTH